MEKEVFSPNIKKGAGNFLKFKFYNLYLLKPPWK